MISPDLARTYAEHLAVNDEDAEDEDEALIDAHTTIAAMGLIPAIKDELEAAAETLARQWLADHREAIRALTDERQEVYREIREMSADPLDVDLARPQTWLQPTTVKEANGTEIALPRYEKHLMCDGEGKFPDELNNWEKIVLATEMKADDRVSWYRNPDRAMQESLGIVYDEAGAAKILRPDFVFFSRAADGSIVADIVDPHGHHLADALPKLRGLARYAEINGALFRRIEAVSEINGKYRMLDLQKPEVRDALDLATTTAEPVYLGSMGADYAV